MGSVKRTEVGGAAARRLPQRRNGRTGLDPRAFRRTKREKSQNRRNRRFSFDASFVWTVNSHDTNIEKTPSSLLATTLMKLFVSTDCRLCSNLPAESVNQSISSFFAETLVVDRSRKAKIPDLRIPKNHTAEIISQNVLRKAKSPALRIRKNTSCLIR